MTDSDPEPSPTCKRCGALARPEYIVYCKPCYQLMAKTLIDECFQAGVRHAEAERRLKEFERETGG